VSLSHRRLGEVLTSSPGKLAPAGASAGVNSVDLFPSWQGLAS
jgi:hypothetical protein